MNVLKDGASESYTVALENSDGTFTITATTPSGNEIVISKSDDSFVMTVTKDFAEALGLEVHAMGSDTVKPLVVNAEIAPSSKSLITGEKTELIVSVDKGEIDSVEWTVEGDADAVTVVQDATNKAKFTVTAAKAGTATLKAEVTAKSGERSGKGTATATITVKNDYNPEVTLTGAPAEMSVNDTADLTVSVDSGNITSVKWTVEGDAVTVQDTTEKTNRVTAVKAGTATVKATVTAEDADGTEKTVELEPAVIKVKYEPEVTISGAPEGKLAVTKTAELSVSVNSGVINSDSVAWSVDDDSVAEITQAADKTKAVITAKKNGTVKVSATVTATGGGQTTEPMTVSKDIEVEYKVEASVNKTLGLDLSNPASYAIDDGNKTSGDDTTAEYNRKKNTLDVTVANLHGIIFKNPAQNPDEYKYVTITYTVNKAMNAYVFDGEMGVDTVNGGQPEIPGSGQGPDGQKDKAGLTVAEGETTVTYSADETGKIYGLKLVHLDFAAFAPNAPHVDPMNLSIKSVVFTSDDPSKSDESNKMQVNDTAVLSAGVDIGKVEAVSWEITDGAEFAEFMDISNDENKKVIIANKVGKVTVEAKVTAELDGMKAEDTVSYEIEVTPITYEIGMPVTYNTNADWRTLLLDSPIVVKKTDIVEVIFSVKSGVDATDLKEDNSTKINIKLSPKVLEDEGGILPNKVAEWASLKMESSSVAGKVKLELDDTQFTENHSIIKNICISPETVTGNLTVTVDKILITPTNDIALSMHAPGAVEIGKDIDVSAEIDKSDYDSIIWKSSDDTKATVKVSETDDREAVVTGKAKGTVKITASIMKNGEEVKIKGNSVDIEVRSGYKDKPFEQDLSQARGDGGTVTLNDDNSITIDKCNNVFLKLPYSVKSGDKIELEIAGKIEDPSAGFRIYTAKNTGTGVDQGSSIFTWNPSIEEFGAGTFDFTGEKNKFVLEVSEDCDELLIRMPGWTFSTSTIDNVTITKLILTYVD